MHSFNWRINWKEEPYKSAKAIANNKKDAIELIRIMNYLYDLR